MEPPVLHPYHDGPRNWLRTATKGLCDEAIERICQEIEAHYTEAVDAHREEGVSEDEAHARALALLGPPSKAVRAFRRTHLTAGEAKRIQGLLYAEQGQARWLHPFERLDMLTIWVVLVQATVVFLCILLAGLAGYPTERFGTQATFAVLVFGLMGGYALVGATLKYLVHLNRRHGVGSENAEARRRSPDQVVFSYMVRAYFLSWFLLAMMLAYGFFTTSEDVVVFEIVFGSSAVAMLVLPWLHLPLWLKLRRGADFTDPRGRQG